MTARDVLGGLLGHEVTVTNPLTSMVMARGVLVGLLDEPSVCIRDADGHATSWPQSFLIGPDLTADARLVIAALEKYEEEHGYHCDGWPCLYAALDAARAAVPS